MSNETEIETVELDGDGLENPVYCGHQRGRNWGAILTGKNAAQMERHFLRQKENIIDLEPVAVGHVLEIAGDYFTCSGRRDPDRLYWRVIEKTEDEMKVEVYPTPAKALKAARLAKENASKTEESQAA